MTPQYECPEIVTLTSDQLLKLLGPAQGYGLSTGIERSDVPFDGAPSGNSGPLRRR